MIQKHTTDDKDYLTIKGWADMIVIQGENKQEFIKFALKTLKELGYQTEIEKGLCEEYIFLRWKLRRAITHERDVLSEQNRRLTDLERIKIENGRISGRRVRNIERIDMSDPSVINLIQQQHELEKRINKTLDRIRDEQRINTEK
jgi:hypothetical protein